MIRASDLLPSPERKPPTTEVLYGREWSAEDAAYARELQEDKSLSAVDITRLWAESRPSVRAIKTPETMNGSPVKEIGGPIKTPDDDVERLKTDAERLKTVRQERNARYYAARKARGVAKGSD
jgi:hypothetical protein